MRAFEKELAELLRKHGVALIAKSLRDENDLAVELGFQKGLIKNKWTGRHHVTAYDLDGVNTSRLAKET